VRLQVVEEPPAEPQPTGRGRDPHPLDLGGGTAVELERAASDGLAVGGGNQEETRGRRQLVVVGGDAAAGVEAAGEAV
jgi:hypothetical protein